MNKYYYWIYRDFLRNDLQLIMINKRKYKINFYYDRAEGDISEIGNFLEEDLFLSTYGIFKEI